MFDIVDQNTGRIVQTQSNQLGVPDGCIAVATSEVVSSEDFFYNMASAEPEKIARPERPAVPSDVVADEVDPATGAKFFVLSWADFDSSCVIFVEREAGDVVVCDDHSSAIELLPGSYRLSVVQDFPHQSFEQDLVVTNA